ncbi:MAG: pyruvate kinase alpha/beta domain-containing protein, partial [Bacteroidota bacterium]
SIPGGGIHGPYYPDGGRSIGNLLPRSSSFPRLHHLYLASRAAMRVDAKAIVGFTKSGYTAFQVSSYRPKSGIIIFTPNLPLLTRLSLVWGVRALYYDKLTSTDETIDDVARILKANAWLKSGDTVVNTGVMPLRSVHRANFIKLTVIE